jgi:signal transduction histidine kinase
VHLSEIPKYGALHEPRAIPDGLALSNSSRTALIVLSMAIVFAIDVRLPVGVAGAILYVAPILLTLWFQRARAPLLAAAGATILVLTGFLFAEPQVRAISSNVLTNRLLAIGVIWTTAALAGLYARTTVRDTRVRKQWEEAVREAESVRTLAGGLLREQQQERRRISRELHDGVNQMLAALSMELSVLESQTAGPDAARDRISRIENRVVAISDEIRRVSHELHPSILEHAGFAAALGSHCREFAKQTGIQALVSTDNVPERIDPEVAASLFRLSQEALQNVAKHSAATEVRLQVSGNSGEVRLTIVDNGRGFDLARARSRGGLGLVRMNERARSLGGHFSIESTPQEGVTVAVRVPLGPCPPDARTPDPSDASSP